jgi:prepilin-type N-terminal cleavage/methylation domain-containing protein
VSHGERGMTLPEVLVAAALIGLGSLALVSIVPISSYGLHEGSQLSTAIFLAEQRLEQVRTANWTRSLDSDCLGLGTGGAPTVPPGKSCRLGETVLSAGTVTFPDEVEVPGLPGYHRAVRIHDCGVLACAGVADPDVRMVSATVTYAPLTGIGVATGRKSVALHLVVSKR